MTEVMNPTVEACLQDDRLKSPLDLRSPLRATLPALLPLRARWQHCRRTPPRCRLRGPWHKSHKLRQTIRCENLKPLRSVLSISLSIRIYLSIHYLILPIICFWFLVFFLFVISCFCCCCFFYLARCNTLRSMNIINPLTPPQPLLACSKLLCAL